MLKLQVSDPSTRAQKGFYYMHVMRIRWEESVTWDLDTEKTLGIVCNICVSLVPKELSNNPCVLLGTYGLGFSLYQHSSQPFEALCLLLHHRVCSRAEG